MSGLTCNVCWWRGSWIFPVSKRIFDWIFVCETRCTLTPVSNVHILVKFRSCVLCTGYSVLLTSDIRLYPYTCTGTLIANANYSIENWWLYEDLELMWSIGKVCLTHQLITHTHNATESRRKNVFWKLWIRFESRKKTVNFRTKNVNHVIALTLLLMQHCSRTLAIRWLCKTRVAPHSPTREIRNRLHVCGE